MILGTIDVGPCALNADQCFHWERGARLFEG